MNLSELEKKLSEVKLSSWHHYYKGIYHGDGLCLESNNGVWEVYDIERATKNIIGTFDSENDACEYIFCYHKKLSDAKRWF